MALLDHSVDHGRDMQVPRGFLVIVLALASWGALGILGYLAWSAVRLVLGLR